MDLTTLSPGDQVTAFGDVYLYAGTVDGRAVLVADLRADLSRGYTGYPAVTSFLTATATAKAHLAVLAHPRHLSQV